MSESENTLHPLLSYVEKNSLRPVRAEEYARNLAFHCGVSGSKEIHVNDVIEFDNGINTTILSEKNHAVTHGIGDVLQKIYDSKNQLFNISPILPIGFSQTGASGINISINGSSASKSMAQYNPLERISNDIIHMRSLCVENSHSAYSCLPFYSAYLTLCITLVDCYINYLSKYFEDNRSKISISEYVEGALKIPTPQERKIEILWNSVFLNHNNDKDEYLTVFCAFANEENIIDSLKDGFSELKGKNCWECYIALKKERNDYIHPNDHVSEIYIETIKDMLNKCSGIGSFLLEVTKHNSLFFDMSFIRKLIYVQDIDLK